MDGQNGKLSAPEIVTQADGIDAYPYQASRAITALYDGVVSLSIFDSEEDAEQGIKVYVNNHLIATNGGYVTQVGMRGYNQVTFPVRKGDVYYFEGYYNGTIDNFPHTNDIYTAWWYK